MTNIIEGVAWIILGLAMMYWRIKSPYPKWKPDVLARNGKLVIASFIFLIVGLLMLAGKAKPIVASMFF